MKIMITMDEAIEKIIELLKMVEKTSAQNIKSKDLQPFINQYMSFAYYESNETIIAAGQRLSEIIYIVKGEFRLSRNSMEGGQVMITRVWGPDFLGIPQLIADDKTFYSEIRAVTDCLAMKFNCKLFLRAMQSSAAVSFACVKSMSQVMSRNYQYIERLRLFSAKENMINYLFRKWMEAGGDLEKPLCVKEKRAEIADELGITVRTVCRILNSLKESGLLTTENNGTIHCAPEQIRRIRKLNLMM